MLAGYGEEIEFDLFLRGMHLADFLSGDGPGTVNGLANIIGHLDGYRTSHLRAARVTDVDAYRAAHPDGPPEHDGVRRRPPPPEHTEVTLEASLLMDALQVLHSAAHYTAAQCAKGTPRPKRLQLLRPVTAETLVRRENQLQAFTDIELSITYLPTAEFRRVVAEHEGEVLRGDLSGR